MNMKEILAISGKPGLYKMVSQAKQSIIVESLIDGKRVPAFTYNKVISLEDIAIYTETEDIPLSVVLTSIRDKEDGGQTISTKSSGQELKAYFEEILPMFDRDRVYVSDIKKVLNWYNLLQEKDLLSILDKKEEESEIPSEAE